MHPSLLRIIIGALALVVAEPLTTAAQGFGQPPEQAQLTPQAPLYSPAQLDQLLAPIALYPDQLLAQILTAATYPLEVVQADRWLMDPNNAAMKGDQLSAALAPIDWDPSVKSLVPFPQILSMMDQRIDWTQNLGDAFLAQQGDVMDSVQRLRRDAQAAGTLQTTPQQTVMTSGQTIIIQPASPTVVYVPVYNPAVVYGAWRYPDYPPVYLSPPAGLYLGSAVIAGIGFSIGFGIIHTLWGWDDWDWGHHRLHVDPRRYNVINNYFIQHDRRPRLESDNWTHDPYHRRGTVYRDPKTRATFRSAPAVGADARRDFRGYDRSAPAQQANRVTAAPQAKPAERRPAEQHPAERAAPAQPKAAEHPSPRPNAQPPSPAAQRPVESAKRPPAAAAPRQQVQRPAATVQHPPAAAQRAPAPAFQGGFAKGADVRAQAERGRASRKTTAPKPTAAPRASPPPVAGRPSGGVRPASDGGKGGGEKPSDKERRQQ